MKREKSCGAVIIQEQSGLRRYLVLHSTQGHWTLCKGHVEGTRRSARPPCGKLWRRLA